MKILFVIDSLGGGGAEKSTSDLWYYLKENGVQVVAVVLRHSEEGVEKQILADGFDVRFLRGSNIFWHTFQLRRIVRSEKPAIVHSVLSKSNFRARLVKATSLSPFVYVESLVNCPYNASDLDWSIVRRCKVFGCKVFNRVTARLFVDRFHAVSNTVKDHYQKHLGISGKKTSVVHRGRKANPYIDDTQVRYQYRKNLGVHDNELLITTVGRQDRQKGHVYLVEALARLRSMFPEVAFKCLIVGRTGQTTGDIQQRIHQYGLEENISLVGHRSDVHQILCATDIFVFPSLFEGLPGAVIEAQAARLPIICSDIPVLREVVGTSKSALFVTPQDTAGFAGQIKKLLDTPNMCRDLGNRAYEYFGKNYRQEQIHRDMLAWYKAVAAGK